jgi:two-component system CheB/CheR fusion protein
MAAGGMTRFSARSDESKLEAPRSASEHAPSSPDLLAALEELREAKQQAEEASRAKDEFLAVLSHELRTPLAPVVAATAMLERRSDLPSSVRADIQMIRRNVELEARLIDDLLDLTRVSRGLIEICPESVDVATLLEETIEICAGDIVAKNLRVDLDVAENDLLVRGDAARLRQVLWNLLKNSIKFTPFGGHVLLYATHETSSQILVEVRDEGEGIDAADLNRIFAAFERGSRHGRGGGLGLGLAISKALVELHGGTISVHSPGRGCGSTFAIRLPAGNKTDPPARSKPPAAKPVASLRILLVEDDADSRSMMARLLELDGHSVETAENAAAAFALASSKSFDLLVSDLGLPDENGLELMRRITHAGLALPSIALSGYGMQDDLDNSRDAGFLAHLVKPVNPRELTLAIQRLTATRR